MDPVDPRAGSGELAAQIVGDERRHPRRFALGPVTEQRPRQRHVRAVALRVDLRSEEVDDLVSPVRELVDAGRVVAQLPLGADLLEEDREETAELGDLAVAGRHRRVEQPADIALEQVRVGDQGSVHGQRDRQRGDQRRAPRGVQRDQLEPDADILRLVGSWADLGVLLGTPRPGTNEAGRHDLLQEPLDEGPALGGVDNLAEAQQAAEHGAVVTRAPTPELVADRADDPVDRLVVTAVKGAERRLQVPEQHPLQVIHARQVHRVEQVACPVTGGWSRIEQRPDLVCDLVKVVDRAQGGPGLGLLQRPFESGPVAGPERGDAARVVVIEERAPRLVPLLDPQRCSPELDAGAESIPQQGADGRLRARVGDEGRGHRLEIARRPREAHRLGTHRAIQLPDADVDGRVEAVWTRGLEEQGGELEHGVARALAHPERRIEGEQRPERVRECGHRSWWIAALEVEPEVPEHDRAQLRASLGDIGKRMAELPQAGRRPLVGPRPVLTHAQEPLVFGRKLDVVEGPARALQVGAQGLGSDRLDAHEIACSFAFDRGPLHVGRRGRRLSRARGPFFVAPAAARSWA